MDGWTYTDRRADNPNPPKKHNCFSDRGGINIREVGLSSLRLTYLLTSNFFFNKYSMQFASVY